MQSLLSAKFFVTVGIAIVGTSLLLPACSEPGESLGGSGGSPAGSGGAVAASGGAKAGTGGASSGAGGTSSTGSGGTVVVGTGGAASGGMTASGGAANSGGSSGRGGNPVATGGAANSGGRGGNAGSASGGAIGSGGQAGAAVGSTGGSSSGGSTGSVVCPSPVLKAGDMTQTVQVGSTSRSYILHVPAKYDGSKPAPFVVDFHPLGGSGSQERSGSPYPAQTDPEGVIMAFPTGMSGPSGGAWNVGPCCVANVDDVAFAKALVAQVQKTACVDPKRIYAVGFSMGGGMSHYLACHAADVFAAVAPAAFDLLQENVGGCKPSRPITVVSFRSTGDQVVNYAGGASSVVTGMPITFLGAKATFQKWSQLNQCTGSASAEDSKGCATYSTCQGGVEVVLCTKQGGSHEAGNASVGWPILKRHTMP